MGRMSSCPCKSGKNLESCCGPYISGKKPAPTAEALMRSRYTAYATGEIDYVEKTSAPEALREFDREASQQWAKQSEWTGLEVVSTTKGQESDSDGIVEFIAHYTIAGKSVPHHEISEFRKENGQWLFVDGKVVRDPVRNEGPKVGRNDPCPCGSGKKYKKCCAA